MINIVASAGVLRAIVILSSQRSTFDGRGLLRVEGHLSDNLPRLFPEIVRVTTQVGGLRLVR